MDYSLRRYELEEMAEASLLEVAQTLVGSGPEDLKEAHDYEIYFFGGKFPQLGLAVSRTQGFSRFADKPSRPGTLIGKVWIYYPAMPNQGIQEKGQNRMEEAKRLTRRIRGRFIEAVFDSSIGQSISQVDSRGGTRNEVGVARTDERGRDVLYIDETEIHIGT